MTDRGFRRLWTAATVSAFGTSVTAVALPVLVVQELDASAQAVGLVSAAQVLPYAVLGLVAGVHVDRLPRRPVLMWSSLGRAATLGAVPVLWATGLLDVASLVVLLLLFGSFSVFGFAATQSLLPALVPRERLVTANARLDQGDAAAQTLGPAVGGGLVALLGAPLAIAVDAASYLLDAALIRRLPVEEAPRDGTRRRLRQEVAEGLSWTYRHRILGPLATSTHLWFLAHAAGTVALAVVALRDVGLSAGAFGLVIGAGGIAALAGATIAPGVGRRVGAGRAILLTRTIHPLTWLLVATAPSGPAPGLVLGAAVALQGLAMGVENANDTGSWQTITPDRLLGRANATRRSVNRTAAALGALVGGSALGLLGAPTTLGIVAAVSTTSAVVVAASPVRSLRTEPDPASLSG